MRKIAIGLAVGAAVLTGTASAEDTPPAKKPAAQQPSKPDVKRVQGASSKGDAAFPKTPAQTGAAKGDAKAFPKTPPASTAKPADTGAFPKAPPAGAPATPPAQK